MAWVWSATLTKPWLGNSRQTSAYLGAGGAVRGILEPILAEQPQHVVIANRSVEKALQLSKGFAEMGYILGCGLDMLDGQEFDLIINGTSASLKGGMPPLPDSLLGCPG